MNKTETMARLLPSLEPVFTQKGYKYLKTQEKFVCRYKFGKKSFLMGLTYWPSSKYCMFSPAMGIHFELIEKFKAKYIEGKLDPHFVSLHTVFMNLEGGELCSFHSAQDIDKHTPKIQYDIDNIYLPYIDNLSDHNKAVQMVLDRSYDNFMNEYDRLLFLFSYIGAYEAYEIVNQVVDSYEPSRKHKNQLIPHHKQQLNLLRKGIPEIEMIDRL